jgi:hypothetical protein
MAEMEKRTITDVQLWRKNALTGICIFRAQQGSSARTAKEIYIEATDMLQDFSSERWVIDPLTLLSNVRSYRVVTLGDGATKKPKERSIVGPPDSWADPKEDRFCNIWSSEENALKHCLQGCLTNILHHIRAGDEALEFKRLSTLDNVSLLQELKLNSFPSKVLRGDGQKIDEFEKCKWLLRRFNCNTTKPLNVTQFRSLSSLMDNFSQFKFPVIVSLEVTNSAYSHVIGIWNKMIIDFEYKSAYPLTINNLDFSCGCESTFVRVLRGYGIFPSKKMKKACRQVDGYSDWGESDVSGSLNYLFKRGKFQ